MNNFKWKSAINYSVTGWIIGLLIISLFVFSVGDPKPEWGEYWRMKPLILTPLAGAAGGLWFYMITRVNFEKQWAKFGAYLVGVLGFIMVLWLGTVLGLAETLWD